MFLGDSTVQQAVRETAIICPCPLQVDLFTLKVVSQVMYDVGYLSANFSLLRPLCGSVA